MRIYCVLGIFLRIFFDGFNFVGVYSLKDIDKLIGSDSIWWRVNYGGSIGGYENIKELLLFRSEGLDNFFFSLVWV